MSTERPVSQRDWSVLLAEVGRGDVDAFQTLLRSSSPLVYGAALRFAGDEVTAASLLRATYEEVWRLAPCYDRQAGPPRSWILALCRVQILEYGQKQRRGDFAPRGPGGTAARTADFDILEQCWFGGLRTGPSSAADRQRFARALRAVADVPLGEVVIVDA